MKRKILIICLLAILAGIVGCEGTEKDTENSEAEPIQTMELESVTNETKERDMQDEDTLEPTLAPSKEQVMEMRASCLAGMTDEEVDRLCENIKVANLTLEKAYFYDNLFERLSDSDNLYWNYIDEKGDIIIGYESEGGEPITTYNRFNSRNFIDLMTEMMESLHSEAFKADFEALIFNMEMAGTTHDVKYIEAIFHILHDMDYYLLRYAPEELGAYVTDRGMISKYYGALSVYESEQNEAAERDLAHVDFIKVQNPSWEYYFDGTEVQTADTTVELELISEEQNAITDEEKWLADNNLDIQRFPYEDENYLYEASGDNAYYAYLLKLSDRRTNETITFDFTDYMYADEYVQEDYDFIRQRIIYAQVKDGILYVATGHNTYAYSCPHNAYITAIDMTDYHVIWKTEPLTCNAASFVIIDNDIICGYGFTDEDDYLKIVDMKTGAVTKEIPIRTKAEHIIKKDDKLYVRTYNMNYVFGLLAGDK